MPTSKVTDKPCCLICLVKNISFSLCLALLTPAMAKAEETVQPVQMDEVRVSATRIDREIAEVPISVSVITSKEMERQPQGTIAQHLQDIPGVMVTDGGVGGGVKRVMIRGEGGSRVLILVDGIKISEQKSMDGAQLLVDPNNIERIEVIKGPASVLYGSEAIGGVVNIITKKGGEKPVQADVSVTIDSSNGSVTPYGSLYGSSGGFSYRVSGNYVDADDRIGGSGKIDNSDFIEYNYSGMLEYATGPAKIGVQYEKFSANMSIPAASTSPTTTIELGLPEWSREKFQVYAGVDDISDTLQKISVVGFYQETQKDFWNHITVKPGRPVGLMLQDMNIMTENEQNTYGFNVQTDWVIADSHYLVAGLEYANDELTATSTVDSLTQIKMRPMGPTISMKSNTMYDYKGVQETFAGFMQDEWSITDNWVATFGVRVTHLKSSLDESTDPQALIRSDSDTSVVGNVGIVYSGIENWSLRALYSQGYSYPTLQQLFIGTTHGSADVTYANPDLDPERSSSYEIGVRYNDGALNIDNALFFTDAKDYITRVQESGKYRFDNISKARTYGFESTIAYTYAPWRLTPYASGTVLYREFDGTARETSLTGVPRFTSRIGVKQEYAFSENLDLHYDVFGRFATGSKEWNGDVIDRDGGWGTAHFAVGARFGEEKQYSIDLLLNNIFDKKYTQAPSTLESAGMHAVVRFGVSF